MACGGRGSRPLASIVRLPLVWHPVNAAPVRDATYRAGGGSAVLKMMSGNDSMTYTSDGVSKTVSLGGISIYLPPKCSRMSQGYYANSSVNPWEYGGIGSVWAAQAEWDEFLRGFAPPNQDLASDGNPLPPSNLTASASRNPLKVSLAWTAPATRGVTYSVLRGTSSGVYSVLDSGLTSTTYTDTNVKLRTKYYYSVKAQVCDHTSAAAGEVTATTPYR